MKESFIVGVVCAVVVGLLCALVIVVGGIISEMEIQGGVFPQDPPQVIYVILCPDGACPEVTPFWVTPVGLGGG